jgi:hypothetical protein
MMLYPVEGRLKVDKWIPTENLLATTVVVENVRMEPGSEKEISCHPMLEWAFHGLSKTGNIISIGK